MERSGIRYELAGNLQVLGPHVHAGCQVRFLGRSRHLDAAQPRKQVEPGSLRRLRVQQLQQQRLGVRGPPRGLICHGQPVPVVLGPVGYCRVWLLRGLHLRHNAVELAG